MCFNAPTFIFKWFFRQLFKSIYARKSKNIKLELVYQVNRRQTEVKLPKLPRPPNNNDFTLQETKDANAIDSLLGYGLAKSSLPLDSEWTIIYQQNFVILKDIYYEGLVGIEPCVFILIDAIEESIGGKVKSQEERHQNFVHLFSESVKNILEEGEYIMNQWKVMQRVECEICSLKGIVAEMGILNCRHMFHPQCITSYLQSKIETNQVELECPMDGCHYHLDNQQIYSFLDSQLKKKYETFCFNKFVQKNAESISWCPTAGCTAIFQFDRDITEYSCTVCLKDYCLSCRCEYHGGLTCEQYKKQVSDRQIDDAFVVFAKGAKFKQCPKCKFWVERITGCNSMNCKCGQNFCYNCGGTGCQHFKCKRA